MADDNKFQPGDRVWLKGVGLRGEIIGPDPDNPDWWRVKWDGNPGTSTHAYDDLTLALPGKPRPSAQPPAEPWADFGLIYQFAFPYPGGLYLSFRAVVDGALVVVEIPFTRQTLAGSVFRQSTKSEITMMTTAGWVPAPKWTWIIPQLKYRIFTASDMVKEMMMMWAMGWEPSEGVKAALAQASQEGTEELERERKMRDAVTNDGLEAWLPDGGKGWKQ